jgi:hypothetical protein
MDTGSNAFRDLGTALSTAVHCADPFNASSEIPRPSGLDSTSLLPSAEPLALSRQAAVVSVQKDLAPVFPNGYVGCHFGATRTGEGGGFGLADLTVLIFGFGPADFILTEFHFGRDGGVVLTSLGIPSVLAGGG